MKKILITLFVLATISLNAQRTYWQQEAEYKMDIDMDVTTNQFTGKQTLKYINNSADTLLKAFYHLQFNAFQPESMMDVRSRTISDADPRVQGRIQNLKPDEMGYQKVISLEMNGKPAKHHTEGTILEVVLPEPILPGQTAVFTMDFEAQVPLQIRRSGRDNKEGIRYSMTQWYPKMAEYDYMGWHADPYIGREFYGIYGKFDVTINIDKNYMIGGTGVLQNPQEIGYGYEAEGQKVNRKEGEKLSWNFVADNVHDFAWAADPDYKHIKTTREDGVTLHFIYQPKDEGNEENWEMLPNIMDKAMTHMEQNFGQYPYSDYTFIQGGDGGMEYPMATLITGHRNIGSLVGVSVHEFYHSWYQGVLGTNESLYPWMDEGFTSYGSSLTMNYLKQQKMIPGEPEADPLLGTVQGHINYTKSGLAEPISTHADHYTRNSAYSVASYVKGSAFLHQIQYIVGEAAFKRGMLRYYNTWKFQHPTPNDFLRIMEKESGLELDWFAQYYINTTAIPDYGIEKMTRTGNKEVTVSLKKSGTFPMPLDVLVTYKNGEKELFYIPLQMMRGEKQEEMEGVTKTILPDWGWVYPTYQFTIAKKPKKIESVVIDPSQRMADLEPLNNKMTGKNIDKDKPAKQKSKKD